MANILLIDDDTNIHQIVSLFLENAGHTVSCVTNGPSGLDFAAHNDVNLIILDLAMPGMDGVETFHQLQNNPATKAIAVMILSVHEESELPEAICKQGCVAFVTKPVNMEQLIVSVEEALAR